MIEPQTLANHNHTFSNATADVSSGFAAADGLFPILLIVVIYATAALLAANFVAPWLAKSTVLGRVGSILTSAFEYAIKGLATTAVLCIVALPAYLLLTVDASTRATGLKWAGYALAAVLILIGIGQLADRAVARFINAHPDAESWSELIGSEDLPEPNDLKEVSDD